MTESYEIWWPSNTPGNSGRTGCYSKARPLDVRIYLPWAHTPEFCAGTGLAA
jgi:hypothetical protein